MANHHPSPTMMQMQHQAQVAPPQNVQPGHFAPSHQINAMNEAVWLQIGECRRRRQRKPRPGFITY